MNLCAIGNRRPMPKAFVVTFRPGSGLLPLVFVAIDLVDDVANQLDIHARASAAICGGALRLLDVALQNAIEHVVLGKRVGVFLIRPQLRGRRLGEDVLRNRIVMPPVRDARQLVDERLRNVADDGQSAAHVAVQSAVADGEFALVSGGEHQRARLVGQRHQRHASQARLQVLFGDVRRRAAENRSPALPGTRSYIGLIGTISKRMPRCSAMSRASATLCSDEYGPGMPTPVTFSRPTASTAIAAVSE